MICAECDGKTHVIRTEKRPYNILRRRECLKCGHRFTTIEMSKKHARAIQKTVNALNKVRSDMLRFPSEIFDGRRL